MARSAVWRCYCWATSVGEGVERRGGSNIVYRPPVPRRRQSGAVLVQDATHPLTAIRSSPRDRRRGTPSAATDSVLRVLSCGSERAGVPCIILATKAVAGRCLPWVQWKETNSVYCLRFTRVRGVPLAGEALGFGELGGLHLAVVSLLRAGDHAPMHQTRITERDAVVIMTARNIRFERRLASPRSVESLPT